MNCDIYKEDILFFSKHFSLSEELKGKSFLITGITGLIGKTLTHCLLSLNKNIKIVAPVRDLNKASMLFKGCCNLTLIESSLINYSEYLLNNQPKIDFIIHCASPTNGDYISQHPVETFETSFLVMRYFLEYARKVKSCNLIYISSIEYYGVIERGITVRENSKGYIDEYSMRSSYPLSKQATEFICRAYASEYNINVKSVRLTQTFGAGVNDNDNRVISQFARCVIENKNIVLHSSGESSKSYIYTIDAIVGILYVLLKGEKGESYNVCNDSTYLSVKDLARFFRYNFNKTIDIVFESKQINNYAPDSFLKLSSDKLRQLGWMPHFNLYEMADRLIKFLK